MEEQRAAGVLRGSLDAAVTLCCSDALLHTLEMLGNELRFVLISSGARLEPLSAATHAVETEVEGLKLEIAVMDEEKCERCWHRSADIGVNTTHPTLCGRCIENIDGEGESRLYA